MLVSAVGAVNNGAHTPLDARPLSLRPALPRLTVPHQQGGIIANAARPRCAKTTAGVVIPRPTNLVLRQLCLSSTAIDKALNFSMARNGKSDQNQRRETAQRIPKNRTTSSLLFSTLCQILRRSTNDKHDRRIARAAPISVYFDKTAEELIAIAYASAAPAPP